MKRYIKKLLTTISLLFVAPFIIITQAAPSPQRNGIFTFWSKALSLIPGMTGIYLRRSFYQYTLEDCGHDLSVEFGSFFTKPQISLGDNVYIGAYCIIGSVNIGHNVLIASRVSVLSGAKQHADSSTNTQSIVRAPSYKKISIGESSWIGEGAILMNNIGNDVIIGAGSVVVKEVENSITAVGNPAKALTKNQREK